MWSFYLEWIEKIKFISCIEFCHFVFFNYILVKTDFKDMSIIFLTNFLNKKKKLNIFLYYTFWMIVKISLSFSGFIDYFLTFLLWPYLEIFNPSIFSFLNRLFIGWSWSSFLAFLVPLFFCFGFAWNFDSWLFKLFCATGLLVSKSFSVNFSLAFFVFFVSYFFCTSNDFLPLVRLSLHIFLFFCLPFSLVLRIPSLSSPFCILK